MTQGRYRSMTLTSVRACAGRGAMMGVVEKLETLASIETRSTFAGMAVPSVRDVGGQLERRPCMENQAREGSSRATCRRTCLDSTQPLLRFRRSPAHP